MLIFNEKCTTTNLVYHACILINQYNTLIIWRSKPIIFLRSIFVIFSIIKKQYVKLKNKYGAKCVYKNRGNGTITGFFHAVNKFSKIEFSHYRYYLMDGFTLIKHITHWIFICIKFNKNWFFRKVNMLKFKNSKYMNY